MAFDLLSNNLDGVAVIDQPGGVLATADNFIDLYTYAEVYQPELIPQLHMANGLGKITGFLRITGNESSYASDQVQHKEEGRLHNILKDVAVAGTTFTSPTDHNLRITDTVKISDGVGEWQATVQSVTDANVFVATNDAGGAFSFAGNVDIIADFGNSFAKGTENFKQSKRWKTNSIINYSHIIKEVYEINASDMVHKSWVMTEQGPKWFNHEMQRTSDLFDNKFEITQLFWQRRAAGDARGMRGVIPGIESKGNIGNEYITDIEDLSAVARRAKQQGTCREFTVWADHQQMAYFRQLMSNLNAGFIGGANYGVFQNDAEMALKLDFKSVLIDGVTFHFTPWTILEDPTLMGADKFLATSLAYVMVPTGNTYASENGNTVTKPYLSVRYREDGSYSRKREVKIFGPNGTAQSKDAQTTEFLTEATNQLVGANNFFVGRRGVFYN